MTYFLDSAYPLRKKREFVYVYQNNIKVVYTKNTTRVRYVVETKSCHNIVKTLLLEKIFYSR